MEKRKNRELFKDYEAETREKKNFRPIAKLRLYEKNRVSKKI